MGAVVVRELLGREARLEPGNAAGLSIFALRDDESREHQFAHHAIYLAI
jgi:hypothetical protein